MAALRLDFFSVLVSLFLVAVLVSATMMVMISPTEVARLSAYIGREISSCQSDCAKVFVGMTKVRIAAKFNSDCPRNSRAMAAAARFVLPLRHEAGERAGVRWLLGFMGKHDFIKVKREWIVH